MQQCPDRSPAPHAAVPLQVAIELGIWEALLDASLHDEDPEVQEAAIIAIGKLLTPQKEVATKSWPYLRRAVATLFLVRATHITGQHAAAAWHRGRGRARKLR